MYGCERPLFDKERNAQTSNSMPGDLLRQRDATPAAGYTAGVTTRISEFIEKVAFLLTFPLCLPV